MIQNVSPQNLRIAFSFSFFDFCSCTRVQHIRCTSLPLLGFTMYQNLVWRVYRTKYDCQFMQRLSIRYFIVICLLLRAFEHYYLQILCRVAFMCPRKVNKVHVLHTYYSAIGYSIPTKKRVVLIQKEPAEGSSSQRNGFLGRWSSFSCSQQPVPVRAYLVLGTALCLSSVDRHWSQKFFLPYHDSTAVSVFNAWILKLQLAHNLESGLFLTVHHHHHHHHFHYVPISTRVFLLSVVQHREAYTLDLSFSSSL